MFFLIGLGLCDAKDITVRGLETIQKCDRVFLESYTSILTVNKDELEKFYGKKVEVADRDMVEQNSDEILSEAKERNVALLVIGDPFGATTHTDIILRAKERNISYEVIHNASILNAVGCCGLQLYSFGETVSIPFWTENWKPDSFYEKIIANRHRGLHTLCLLDIKVKEPTFESLTRKKKEYMPPTFMTVNVAASQLLQIIENKKPTENDLSLGKFDENTKCVGLARVGSPKQRLVFCTLRKMKEVDLGDPLHSLIIPGTLQVLEEQYLLQFANY
ncbi:hypothetical protein RUM43_007083 [Polyplax serrata]|uniref:diphthine methyl ester synthase n=1 Tax=Polyplax serrata TaxID=468196 RepID=A0AAN8P1D4_POLSC